MPPVRLCFLLLVLAAPLHAERPALEALYPAGAARDSTNAVTLTGKLDPWPPKIWISAAAQDVPWTRRGPLAPAADITFSTETNKGKLTLVVAAHAAPGPRIVRLYNDEGVSEPRFFVVGAGPELTETEPNDHFARPHRVASLPVTVNGRLAKGGDVDSFEVTLLAGQTLEARLNSYTLMSKLDGVLRLTTVDGQQLAWNHDFATLDPRLAWRAEKDQAVVVQVFGFPHPATSQIRLYGSDTAFYRLYLNPGDSADCGGLGGASCTSPLGETCAPELETNDAATAAQPLVPPAHVHGCIDSDTDEDRFNFKAAKDEYFEARITAAAVGSPLDAWLNICDAKGKELTRVDDSNNARDPVIEWKAPADGTYTLVVGSLTHRGGALHRYRLGLKHVFPDFSASLAAGTMTVTAGETNFLKFNVRRLRGHTNELFASVSGLPYDVLAGVTNLASKGGDFEIPLQAATNAAPFYGPIHLYLTDELSREERLVPLPLTSRTEDNGVPGGYTDLLVHTIDHCWLTVRKKPDETPKTAAAK